MNARDIPNSCDRAPRSSLAVTAVSPGDGAGGFISDADYAASGIKRIAPARESTDAFRDLAQVLFAQWVRGGPSSGTL